MPEKLFCKSPLTSARNWLSRFIRFSYVAVLRASGTGRVSVALPWLLPPSVALVFCLASAALGLLALFVSSTPTSLNVTRPTYALRHETWRHVATPLGRE